MKTTLVVMAAAVLAILATPLAAADDVGYRIDLNGDGDCSDPYESYVLHPEIPLVETRVGCTRLE